MNRCPICSAKISATKLMCPDHWGMVPATLQGKVLGSWKAWQRGSNPSIQRMAREEHRAAKEEAIAAVREKVGPKT